MQQNLIKAVITLTVCVHLMSCKSGPVREEPRVSEVPKETSAPATVYEQPIGPEPVLGPEPEKYKDYSYNLIFGPSIVGSAAYVGILKEFEKNKIKINQIVSQGLGNLVNSVYCARGVAGTEWSYSKMKIDLILKKRILRFSNKEMYQSKELLETFKNDLNQFGNTRCKYIATLIGKDGELLEKINTKDPNVSELLFSMSEWNEENSNGRNYLNSNFQNQIQKTDGVKNIYVDVHSKCCKLEKDASASSKERANTNTQLSEKYKKIADEIITVDISDIADDDLSQKAEIIYRAKKAFGVWNQERAKP